MKDSTIRRVSPDELDAARHGAAPPQLVDCRSAAEFAGGHVPGSVNIPVEEMKARLDDIDPSRPVVFICASGRRASIAAGLAESGADVAVLDGGIGAWTTSGRPLVGARRPTWSIDRQVRFIAGVLAATGGLGALLIDARWAIVPVALGIGLAVAAAANNCVLASLLMQMPWNRRQA